MAPVHEVSPDLRPKVDADILMYGVDCIRLGEYTQADGLHP